jgi:hypothetical protein
MPKRKRENNNPLRIVRVPQIEKEKNTSDEHLVYVITWVNDQGSTCLDTQKVFYTFHEALKEAVIGSSYYWDNCSSYSDTPGTYGLNRRAYMRQWKPSEAELTSIMNGLNNRGENIHILPLNIVDFPEKPTIYNTHAMTYLYIAIPQIPLELLAIVIAYLIDCDVTKKEPIKIEPITMESLYGLNYTS